MYKLCVNNIYKRYGDEVIINDITLKAKSGDVISIIGSSGSGKSTFLRCINLLNKPNSGRIFLNDEELILKNNSNNELEALNLKQLQKFRSKLAMVFQNFNLWSHMTAVENIVEAPIQVLKVSKKTAYEKAKYYLDKVNLYDKLNVYPSRLSGGEQQRVAIARALAMEPEVLLFDEPTSALDPERVGDVLEVMRKLADEGRTMIVVTHEIKFARNVSNKIAFFDKGKIIEYGGSSKVLDNPKSERLKFFLTHNYK